VRAAVQPVKRLPLKGASAAEGLSRLQESGVSSQGEGCPAWGPDVRRAGGDDFRIWLKLMAEKWGFKHERPQNR